MVLGLSSMTLDTSGSGWLASYGWALLFVVFMFVSSLYVWSYVSKAFDRLGSREGKFVDRNVANFLEGMVKTVIIIVLVLSAAYVVSLAWHDFDVDIWHPSLRYIFELVIVAIIILTAMLIVHIFRRVARVERQMSKEVGSYKRSTIELTSLVASYIVYTVAIIVTLIVTMYLVFDIRPVEASVDFLDNNGTIIATIIIIFLAIHLVLRLVGDVLEDFKYRTHKFNPQVIDLFRSLIGYALWTIAILTVVFSVFSLFNMAEIGLILVLLILSFIILGVILSYSTVRNGFAGLALMESSPFEVGDRINIGGKLECDVVQKNLMFTEVKTIEGDFVVIPNSKITEDRIFNYSRSIAHTVTVTVQVDFSVSHLDVEKMINDAASRVQGIMKEPGLEVIAIGIEGSSVKYEVRAHVENSLKARGVRSELIFKIQDAFHVAGHKSLAD